MLTENQQQLIDQITQEFISHNKSKQATRGESLLGVDDIINSIQQKRDEIARIKADNEAILEALKPIFEDNFEALAYELNALGLSLKSNHEWRVTSQGLTFVNMKVAMHHDISSDMDFNLEARVSHTYSKWSEILTCKPKLQYIFWDNTFSFEDLCKNQNFVDRIKRMYERKTN
jgi:uncharacterized small protein (DUF1192 family)